MHRQSHSAPPGTPDVEQGVINISEQYYRLKLDWLNTVLMRVCQWLLLFAVMLGFMLVAVFLLCYTDNPVSRRLDQGFRYRQQVRQASCHPCRDTAVSAVDINCCETILNEQISIEKMVASRVDEYLQLQLAGQTVLVNGNKTLKSGDHCAFHVALRNHRQQMSVAPHGGYATVLGWNGHVGQSVFIRNCIEHDISAGQFRVLEGGTYVISSHLAFRGDHYNTRGQIYGQMVMRVGLSDPVLVDVQMGANNVSASSAPVHNSLAVGVAILRPGQLLYVLAKPIDKLMRGNGHSYFSVIKIG